MIEIWKNIEGFEYYQVSNFGNVKSLERNIIQKNGKNYKVTEKLLKPSINNFGYYFVCLYKKTQCSKSKTIHQLVSIAFLEHKPSGYNLVINHKDFNKLNNHESNLEIVSARENTNRKHIKSTSKYVGVCLDKKLNKWCAKIRENGTQKYLGLYINEIDAHNAYQKALKEITKNTIL